MRYLRIAIVLLLASCQTPAPEPVTTIPSTTSPTSVTISTTSPLPTVVRDDGDADPACLRRAQFPLPADSEYLLPYPAGSRYRILQSYCAPGGGHRNQLAYDFSLPVQAVVVAARAGVVVGTREDSPDNGEGDGEHNYVLIEHADGTAAFYAHLLHDGVEVEVGDDVAAGQVIARSGNSGLTGGPHLHFGVYQDWPPREGHDVAVNFRNAVGHLDQRGGLLEGRVYAATD